MSSASVPRVVHPRRLTALVSAIIFVDMITWLAVVPLIPTWQREYDLSPAQSGALLSAYAIAALAFAIPSGYLADRFGPRRITVVGVIAFIVFVPALGFAEGFWSLLVIRMLQGLCSTTIWSAGLGWLSLALEGPARARSLIIANGSATTATVAGPIVGGPMVGAIGVRTTFIVLGMLFGVLLAWALIEPGGPVRSAVIAARDRPFMAIVAARHRGLLQASFIAIAIVALVQGALQLVGALRLDEGGMSTSGIGWVFTAASVAAVAALLVVHRLQERISINTVFLYLPIPVGSATLLLGLQGSIPLYVATLIAVFALASPVFVMAYVGCAEGAERAGVGEGIAFGALNALWALGAVISPLMAGVVLAYGREWFVYLVLFVVALGGTVALRASLASTPGIVRAGGRAS